MQSISTPAGLALHLTDRATGLQRVSTRAASEILGVSTRNLAMLRDAGLVVLTQEELAHLAAARLLTTDTTGLQPVIRMGADDPNVSGGRRLGFHVSMSNAELLEATRMAWRSDVERFLAAQLALISLGTLVVAVISIDGHDTASCLHNGTDPNRTRHAYEARLIARISTIGAPATIVNPRGNEAIFAQSVIGCWQNSRSGGPVSYL